VGRQRQRDKNQCKINYAVARKTPRKTNRRQQDEVASVQRKWNGVVFVVAYTHSIIKLSTNITTMQATNTTKRWKRKSNNLH